MSHLWEMHAINMPTEALHGEKVGVGTVYMLSHIKANADIIDGELVIDERKIFSEGVVRPIFGSLTEGIIKENLPRGEGSSAIAVLGKDSLIKNAEKLRSLISSLPSPESVRAILNRVGGCTEPEDISLPGDPDFIKRSVTYSPYVRNRLTFSKIISAVSVTQGGISK